MVLRFLQFIIFILVISPFVILAQSGKIVGKITDLETGEELIGANILVEGTNLGAASDVNGDFIILNVPPGTFTIVSKYIGYREVKTENIRVSVNLTTEVNFQMPSETYQIDIVVVVAPKPLINKNTTSQVNIVNQEDLKNLPIRTVNAIVGTQTGVVTKGTDIYIRGSRSDGVAFYVDGVLVNDPVFGGSKTSMINNAIEEIQVQAGGYPAEFGGANGGIISTTTRSGSENYTFGFEGITDNFANAGEDFLGGHSYGYSEYTFTASGPVIPNYKDLKFFFAGNNLYQRSQAKYYREYNFQNLIDPINPSFFDFDGNNSFTEGVETHDVFSINYPAGTLLNNGSNTYQLQGNVTWSSNPFSVKLSANHRWNENRQGMGWTNINRVNSAGLNQNYTFTGNIKVTHVVNTNAFYDVILNYFNDYAVQMDPIFQHDITLYGDSLANAQYGRTLLQDGDFVPPIKAYGLSFERFDRPFNGYTKTKYQSFGGKLNFLYQLGKIHEIKTGGEYTYYTVRRYDMPNTVSIANNILSIADGDQRGVYDRLDNYGYDIYGNAVDTGSIGPKHPVFAAFYVQDKMEFSDLVLNLGFRLDYIETDSKTFPNPHNVEFDADGIIDQEKLVDVDPIFQVSPRLGFSFPVTEQTVFHAQYGKFIQQSQLRNIFLGFNRSSDIIKGGFAELNPVGYGIRPERTTQYEIGFKQQLGQNFAFDITGFYKDIKDQVQIRPIFAESGASHVQYYALVNGDFSTVKGIELKLDLRRTDRISASIDYTFSDAQGTGSTPNEAGRAIWQSPTATPFYPVQISPLSFNQTHRGALNVDYRFAADDGPEILGSKVLSNLGLNLLFTFNSGFNYTRFEGFGNARVPLEAVNSSTTPWNFQLDARFDKSFALGPLNLNVYLWVINLLDIKNIVDVFGTSGDAVDDGFLATPEGQAGYNNFLINGGLEAAETYKQLYLASIYDADNFGTPRQIRLGVRLDY